MPALTLRRDVHGAPATIWRRLVDVERFVIDDHDLDLVDLSSDRGLHAGARAVVSHREGRRLSTYDVRVLEAAAATRLLLAVDVGRERWVVTATLTPSPTGTDLRVTADLDPAGTPPAVIGGLTRPLDLGLTERVSALVGRWVDHAAALVPA
jgi:hypothetical protein